jgi:hypothetical protein
LKWNQGPAPVIEEATPEPVTVSKPALALAHSRSNSGALAMPDWVEVLQKKTLELSRLGYDWDGRKSAAVRSDALVFAWHVLSRAMSSAVAAPSLVPLGHGGVQLVWSSRSADIEVEVVNPNHVIIYHADERTGQEDEWKASTDFSTLAELLRTKFPR